MIASSAFFVLDAVLDWPVLIYDGSWSQWGQMSGDTANKGTLDPASPWRTDLLTESFANNFVNAVPAMSAVTFTGAGLDDLSVSGTFTGLVARKFRVEIDGAGAPDTFRWSKDGGTTWAVSSVTITGGGTPQALTEGMSVAFGANAGHTVANRWDFSFTNRQAIEILTFDGSACSRRFNLDDTETVYPAACTPGSPDSFALSGNQVEEEDAAYFGAGGTGGGGGAPITPGY